MKTPIKGILFDFNGTLFFDSQFHLEAFRRCFVRHGLPVPSDLEIIRGIFGRTNRQIYVEHFSPDGSDGGVEAFADEKEGLYRDLCMEQPDKMKWTDGAEELFRFLQEKKIPYALATGSGLDNLTFYREQMGFDRYFSVDRIVYADGTFPGKPSPDCYLLAAEKIGLKPEECLVFEDGTSGILAARRAGAAAVVAVYEEGLDDPQTADVRADIVAHDFRDWKNVLRKFGIV